MEMEPLGFSMAKEALIKFAGTFWAGLDISGVVPWVLNMLLFL
jgi:hypothetical protein